MKRRMSQEVKVALKSGGESYVGIPISEGPKTVRILVTWPYQAGGRIEVIAIDDIASIDPVGAGPLKEEPEPL